jgi:hypothetical protein
MTRLTRKECEERAAKSMQSLFMNDQKDEYKHVLTDEDGFGHYYCAARNDVIVQREDSRGRMERREGYSPE